MMEPERVGGGACHSLGSKQHPGVISRGGRSPSSVPLNKKKQKALAPLPVCGHCARTGWRGHQVPESRWSRVMVFHLLVMSMYSMSTAAMDKLLLLSLQFLPETETDASPDAETPAPVSSRPVVD